MNIQQVFEELETASDFELFRIKSAIDKVLEDPDRARFLSRLLSKRNCRITTRIAFVTRWFG